MSALKGLVFVLVGSFSVYQYQVKELIETHGGRAVDFIDNSVDFVVLGANSGTGSGKLTYTAKYRAVIITEAELEKMIRNCVAAQEAAQIRNAELDLNKLSIEDYGTW